MARSGRFLALVCVLAVVSNAAAMAALLSPSDRAESWEFSLQTRYVGAQDYEGSGGSSLSLEDDLGWGFGVAYNLDERFSVGCFASWRTVDYSAHVVSRDDPDHTLDWSDWLDTGNIGVNATWHVLPKRFTPYVQGSVGWAMVDSNIPESVDIDCWWDPWWGDICAAYGNTYTEDAASYGFSAGLAAQLTEALFARAGYEKSWIDLDGADNFDMLRIEVGMMFR